MDLVQIIVVIVVIGVLLWLVNNFIPMEPRIKKILNVAVIVFLIIWLLIMLLNFAGIGHMRFGGR